MKLPTTFFFGLWLAMGCQAVAAEGWQCTRPPIEACFKSHGRLSSQNGNGLIGTKRIVVVQNTQFPSFISRYLDMASSNHSYIYGDFEICPLEKDQPGHTSATCVRSAERLVVRNLQDVQPAFRLLST
jgi:hypothetical protein